MDLQKLEKFEDWFATRYPNVQKTIDLHNDHESIVFRNNQMEAWQAAKASAVPDGYCVVPKEPTQELLNKMQDFFVGAFENGLTGGQSIHCAYIAMIEAAQEPTPLKVGDLVEPKDYRYILASGACRYPYAYVVNTNPFQLMSEEGDMYWCCTVEVDGYKLLKSNVQLPKGVVDRMIREGLIAPVEAQEPAND